MSDTIRCPDCGTENDPALDRCANCNFPLHGIPAAATEARTAALDASPASAAPTAAAASDPPIPPAPAAEAAVTVTRPLSRRPRPGRPPADAQSLSLWLFVGGFCVLAVLWIAIKANVDRANVPVEGSSQAQQALSNQLRQALEKDSTDVPSRIALGDVLYDTGNWSEAIVQYRAAVRRDSSQVTAIVDLGVCYYNLSDVVKAEELFRLALTKDPHQPVALFNLGILSERRDDFDQAMRFYHAALQSDPPDLMREPLMKAVERVQQKTGKSAGPLPELR